MKIIPSSRRDHYVARVGVFLVTVALIAGMVGCDGGGDYNPPPSQNLEIQTWYDLAAIRDNLAGNHTLMNDLDSTTAGYQELASPTANQGKGWQPIGNFTNQAQEPFTSFRGTLDGQGYEIRDLFINRPGEDYVGLFGLVYNDGVIKDIGAVNVTVIGNWGVGGLVGDNFGTVSNSYSTGNITGFYYTGGLAGVSYGTVSDSYSSGNVIGGAYVGGLAGGNGGGSVSNSHSTSNVAGNEYVGGLVGDNKFSSTVSDSYSSGNVTGNWYVGGLAGRNWDSTVSSSYSSGSVTGNEYVGGLVGENDGSIVSNSFWDIQTSGQATSDGGTGKNTTEMQEIITFSGVGWDIIEVVDPATPNPTYIWNIPTTPPDYPFLSWEP